MSPPDPLQMVRDELVALTEEVRGYRSDINGRLRALELWKARWEGFSFVFKWLIPATSGIGGVLLTLALTHRF